VRPGARHVSRRGARWHFDRAGPRGRSRGKPLQGRADWLLRRLQRRYVGHQPVRIGVACRLFTASWGLALFASRRVPMREGHDVATPSRVRSEDAVETNERMTRGRDEGAESREKLSRADDAVGLGIRGPLAACSWPPWLGAMDRREGPCRNERTSPPTPNLPALRALRAFSGVRFGRRSRSCWRFS
jgi:hypothetical protein